MTTVKDKNYLFKELMKAMGINNKYNKRQRPFAYNVNKLKSRLTMYKKKCNEIRAEIKKNEKMIEYHAYKIKEPKTKLYAPYNADYQKTEKA